LAAEVRPEEYIGSGWNSSRSKVLDNAVVGFCQAHGLISANKRHRQKESAEKRDLFAWLKRLGIEREWIAERIKAGRADEVQAEIERREKALTTNEK